MSVSISGKQLALWREEARQAAIAARVSPSEVDWLLREVIPDLDSLSLRLGTFQERSQFDLKMSLPSLTQLWQRRLQERLPLQYLVGKVAWRNFTLEVSPAVLIPRPETEYLIDLVLNAIRESSETDLTSGDWVDLGTGSGAIALGLAETLTHAKIHAVDRSSLALAIASKNAENLELSDRITFYRGNWWSPLNHLKGRVSGMLSNPPYIPTHLIEELQPEVACHEPHLALDGGEDGLACIRHLIQTAPDYLRPGGIWLIEMMAGQARQVYHLLKDRGSYQKIQIFSDLAGIDRFALAYHG